MGKSLRNKKERANRRALREDPKSAFNIAEKLRMQRLAASLKQSALKPRALTDKEEWERQQEGYETESDKGDEEKKEEGAEGEAKEGGMEVDGTASTSASTSTSEPAGGKVSTSGPRMSRREAYRSSKGFTVKQTPRTLFPSTGEKKRKGCKPHRRR
ncbi:hypothetical protein JCM8097_003190 [Rhodosporidiobolus ruineniae]